MLLRGMIDHFLWSLAPKEQKTLIFMLTGGIDLITWQGELQNILQSDHIYANDCLRERETYVLVKVVDGK